MPVCSVTGNITNIAGINVSNDRFAERCGVPSSSCPERFAAGVAAFRRGRGALR